jgi:very-short-patch-repair endonuclease
MTNKIIDFNFYPNTSIRTIIINDELHFVSKDICKILNIKNNNCANMSLRKDYTKIGINTNTVMKLSPVQTTHGIQNMMVITKEGVISLVSRCKRINPVRSIDLLKSIGIHTLPIHQRIEFEFLDILIEQLQVLGFNIFLKQHNVKNKMVDLFLPECNIAIEYDENNHDKYSKYDDKERQNLIQKETGCNFIRVSDSNSHISNCAIIIKELIKLKKFNT